MQNTKTNTTAQAQPDNSAKWQDIHCVLNKTQQERDAALSENLKLQEANGDAAAEYVRLIAQIDYEKGQRKLLWQIFQELEAQRDELLAACKRSLTANIATCDRMLRAAIDKVEGNQ